MKFESDPNSRAWNAALGLVAAALLVALPPAVHAQSPTRAESAGSASPFLPPDHWAVDAARRLALLGAAPGGFGWGDGSITQYAAGRVFLAVASAPDDAGARGPEIAVTARGYWQRFAREFPAAAARLEREIPVGAGAAGRLSARTLPVNASLSLRYAAEDGRLLPVRSIDRTRDGFLPPEPLDDLGETRLGATVSAVLGGHAAGELLFERADGQWSAERWHALAGWKGVGVWAGRRSPDYGPGAGGGLVFDGRAAFDGGGIALLDPIRLPWLLRLLGPTRGEMFLSRLDSSAATRHPWVFGARASIAPHPRLLIGGSQAFMFSGEGLPPFTWRNFKEMFLTHGIKVAGSEYENGIAAFDIRWRPPVPKVPAVLYVEWGSDDNHDAWTRFPAVVAGIELPALPGAPALSLGLERTSFSPPCNSCGGCDCEYYATWYRHYVFMDGWTVDRQPIGHPLAGDGSEWLLYGRFDDRARGVRVGARTFARERGRYNLYSPAREGRSAGGSLTLDYYLTPAIELRIHGTIERGRRDWSSSSLFTGARWTP